MRRIYGGIYFIRAYTQAVMGQLCAAVVCVFWHGHSLIIHSRRFALKNKNVDRTLEQKIEKYEYRYIRRTTDKLRITSWLTLPGKAVRTRNHWGAPVLPARFLGTNTWN